MPPPASHQPRTKVNPPNWCATPRPMKSATPTPHVVHGGWRRRSSLFPASWLSGLWRVYSQQGRLPHASFSWKTKKVSEHRSFWHSTGKGFTTHRQLRAKCWDFPSLHSGLVWFGQKWQSLNCFLLDFAAPTDVCNHANASTKKKKKKKKKNMFLKLWCIGICPTKFCNERRCEVLIADNKLIFYGTSRCARHEVAHPFFSQTNKQDSYLQFSNIHCTCPKPEISETSMFEASENARWQNIGADDCIPSRCQGTCSLFPTSEGLRNFCFVIGHRGWVTDHTPIHSGSTSHSIFTSWQQDPDDT